MVDREHEPQFDHAVALGDSLDHGPAPAPPESCRHTPATVTVLDPADLRTLLSTPPPNFVAARNALVKALKAAKERDAATTVSAIRRPAWPDWALNVTSLTHPDDVETFLAAAAAVRSAQEAAADGRAADVRDALQQLRQATATLVDVARPVLDAEGRAGDVIDLRARLTEIAGSGAADQLRTGTLGTGQPDDSPLLAAVRRSRPAATPRRTTTQASPSSPRRDDPPAQDAAARRRLMRQLADAERDLKRSQRAAARAQEDFDEAVEAAARAERRRTEAQQQLDAATAAVAHAEQARLDAATALDATS